MSCGEAELSDDECLMARFILSHPSISSVDSSIHRFTHLLVVKEVRRIAVCR